MTCARGHLGSHVGAHSWQVDVGSTGRAQAGRHAHDDVVSDRKQVPPSYVIDTRPSTVIDTVHKEYWSTTRSKWPHSPCTRDTENGARRRPGRQTCQSLPRTSHFVPRMTTPLIWGGRQGPKYLHPCLPASCTALHCTAQRNGLSSLSNAEGGVEASGSSDRRIRSELTVMAGRTSGVAAAATAGRTGSSQGLGATGAAAGGATAGRTASPEGARPTVWNVRDKSLMLEVSGGTRVKYVGAGETDRDAGSVRSNVAIPPSCGLYYYEVSSRTLASNCTLLTLPHPCALVPHVQVMVISRGRDGYIGVGLCGAQSATNRLPGESTDLSPSWPCYPHAWSLSSAFIT